MIVLGAIEGNILFLVIAAIIGVIQWLSKKGEAPPPSEETRAPKRRPAESEEERVRRFLEALGVPTDNLPPPPVKRREPPPIPQPLPKIQPRGEIVGMPTEPTWPRRKEKPEEERTPVFTHRPVAEKPPAVPELPRAKVQKVERPTVASFQFDTVSSHVTAIPFEASHADMRDAYKTAAEMPVSPEVEDVQELLRSPGNLRNAIVLREILGPPRSLQTGVGAMPF